MPARALERVVRVCCVGEVVSLHLLTEAHGRATDTLVRAVFARLVRDESLHARFGWLCLDACSDWIGAAERTVLGKGLADQLVEAQRLADEPSLAPGAVSARTATAFGWTARDAYRESLATILRTRVLAPLAERGIVPP